MKKQIKHFISELDRINEGLEKRNLTADDVINIFQYPIGSEFPEEMVMVFYKVDDENATFERLWSVDEIITELKDINAFGAAKYFFNNFSK